MRDETTTKKTKRRAAASAKSKAPPMVLLHFRVPAELVLRAAASQAELQRRAVPGQTISLADLHRAIYALGVEASEEWSGPARRAKTLRRVSNDAGAAVAG